MAFEWNVEIANQILDEALQEAALEGKTVFDITTTMDPVATFTSMGKFIGINSSDRPVDMRRPVIAVILPKLRCVIDGWNRIKHAAEAGMDNLPLFTLTPEDELRCRMNVKSPVWAKIDAMKADSKYVAEWLAIEGPHSPTLARIQRQTLKRLEITASSSSDTQA